jgi:hypothetical protein
MMGVILLSAMTAGGISLWYKRRQIQKELDIKENFDTDNFDI